jgi:hypothetical protein
MLKTIHYIEILFTAFIMAITLFFIINVFIIEMFGLVDTETYNIHRVLFSIYFVISLPISYTYLKNNYGN